MKKLKLIIEGPDFSGKSSLLKEVEKYINADTFSAHFTSPPKNVDRILWAKKNFEPMFEAIIKYCENNILLDRSYVSEAVYRKVLCSDLIDYDFTEIQQKFKDSGFAMLYCRTSVNVLKNRAMIRGKDWLISNDNLQTIYNEYEEQLKKVTLPIFIWRNDLESDAEKIEMKQKLINFMETLRGQ